MKRYKIVAEEKAGGVTYTPKNLADFVARQVTRTIRPFSVDRPLRVLDPAIGDGELLVSVLRILIDQLRLDVEVHGFETDKKALEIATARIKDQFSNVALHFELDNFLEFVLKHFGGSVNRNLFRPSVPEAYDLIIANPPYVRTQIMGAFTAQRLAQQFSLTGRVDLYHAFILGMARVLKPEGVAGIIVSNRFMTTKSGASVRKALLERFNIHHVWDLGDTKLFDAAVLPAVLLAEGKNGISHETSAFTSIYQTMQSAHEQVTDPIDALGKEGLVEIDDGRCFQVQHGKLDTGDTPDGVWRIATESADAWLKTVKAHTWGTFRDIGKIRVGVKTSADKVFIRCDWHNMCAAECPELLHPVSTHHIARRFRPSKLDYPKQILYPHESVGGRRQPIDISRYPRSQAYLERHRRVLERRKYVIEAGRKWYEIWVPQDPASWGRTKLVFRDIAEEPTFWIDRNGTVVNGDCYWLVCQTPEQEDLLWLAAAVGNSTFIERFYDYCFHNKLYAGRRRFITQYVEKFPLPDPQGSLGQSIIAKAKQAYEYTPSPESDQIQKELDTMVWEALCGDTPP